jgi:hypothetical protein
VGFVEKVKQFFGVGGVKLELQIRPSYPKAGEKLAGALVLTSKSDQRIEKIKISLVETYTTGRGEDKTSKDYDLGERTLSEPIELKAGETRSMPFDLGFSMLKSDNDVLKEKGGALGALGKMASFASAERSEYEVRAEAEVKGTTFGPSDRKRVQLV